MFLNHCYQLSRSIVIVEGWRTLRGCVCSGTRSSCCHPQVPTCEDCVVTGYLQQSSRRWGQNPGVLGCHDVMCSEVSGPLLVSKGKLLVLVISCFLYHKERFTYCCIPYTTWVGIIQSSSSSLVSFVWHSPWHHQVGFVHAYVSSGPDVLRHFVTGRCVVFLPKFWGKASLNSRFWGLESQGKHSAWRHVRKIRDETFLQVWHIKDSCSMIAGIIAWLVSKSCRAVWMCLCRITLHWTPYIYTLHLSMYQCMHGWTNKWVNKASLNKRNRSMEEYVDV